VTLSSTEEYRGETNSIEMPRKRPGPLFVGYGEETLCREKKRSFYWPARWGDTPNHSSKAYNKKESRPDPEGKKVLQKKKEFAKEKWRCLSKC